jgi:hypothetical protein
MSARGASSIGLIHAARARPHAARAAQPGAAREPHEQRLELIVRGVRRGDERGVRAQRGALKKFAAQRAQARLAREPASLHARARVPARGNERNIQATAEVRDERLICVRLRATQSMVEVRGDQFQRTLARERMQRDE